MWNKNNNSNKDLKKLESFTLTRPRCAAQSYGQNPEGAVSLPTYG